MRHTPPRLAVTAVYSGDEQVSLNTALLDLLTLLARPKTAQRLRSVASSTRALIGGGVGRGRCMTAIFEGREAALSGRRQNEWAARPLPRAALAASPAKGFSGEGELACATQRHHTRNADTS